jgi:hypothetical protein
MPSVDCVTCISLEVQIPEVADPPIRGVSWATLERLSGDTCMASQWGDRQPIV